MSYLDLIREQIKPATKEAQAAGCPVCSCIMFVDGLCWGCSKEKLYEKYPHLKSLGQFRETLWNSAAFYQSKARWQELAQEYQEDYGEEISRDLVFMYAQTLGHELEGEHLVFNNIFLN